MQLCAMMSCGTVGIFCILYAVGLQPVTVQESLVVLASIARDDHSPLRGRPACTVTTMHFRHRQTNRQTDTDIVA